MRRGMIGLACVAAALAAAPTATAAPGQTTHFRFHGSFAEAEWFQSTSTSSTDTYLNVSSGKQGQELFLEQFTQTSDSNGNFTGAADTFADVTAGFTFAIGKKLDTASADGSSLPATTCTFDANFNLIGCTDGTIDVSAQWTGQGPIAKGTFNSHVKQGGFSEHDHFNGTRRDATASGAIGGATLTATDLGFADLGTANSGSGTVCIGNNC